MLQTERIAHPSTPGDCCARAASGHVAEQRDELAPFHCSNASRASDGKDSTVGRETAALLYLGNDFELASFCIGSGPALHLDNTFLKNDDPQLSCLA